MRSPWKTSPSGVFWFSLRSSALMRSTGRSSAAIFSFDSSMWIWRRNPPLVVTDATPATRSSRGESWFSAISRSVTRS